MHQPPVSPELGYLLSLLRELAGTPTADLTPAGGDPGSLLGWAASRGHPLALADTREHPLLRRHRLACAAEQVAVLAHPLHDLDGGPLGLLWASQPSPRRWQPAHRRHIAQLAGLAAASLDRQHATTARGRLQRAHRVLAHEVGHQLRSPLTSLLGQLQLLADGSLGAMSPAQRAAVDAAERAARRLCEQTLGLLAHSGLEPGP